MHLLDPWQPSCLQAPPKHIELVWVTLLGVAQQTPLEGDHLHPEGTLLLEKMVQGPVGSRGQAPTKANFPKFAYHASNGAEPPAGATMTLAAGCSTSSET